MSHSVSQKRSISRVRTWVRIGVTLAIVIGFAFTSGLGTLCATGVNSLVALCPLGALETLVAAKFMVPPALMTTVCMLAIIALLGRAFCAWICPVPPIRTFFDSKAEGASAAASRKDTRSESRRKSSSAEEKVSRIDEGEPSSASHVGEEELSSAACEGDLSSSRRECPAALAPVGGKRDGFHVDSRHVVLLGALASSAVFGFPVFCLICPVGLTFATLVALWAAFVDHNPTWMLLVFPAILVVELVVFRKWCHVLCPLGALMSLVGAKAPVGKPRVDTDQCLRTKGVDCHVCVDACPEKLDPHIKDPVECTRCGLCAEHCPAGALSLGLLPARKVEQDNKE